MSPLLEAVDVAVGFASAAGRVSAVRGVSLCVERGETLGLVGESGCGKSTFARAVLGLERLERGQVRLDGVDFHTAGASTRRALRRRMQPVFQDAGSALDPRMTVATSVAEPLAVHGTVPRVGRKARVAALLDAVQLPADVADRFPHELSAGQRQRVNLARALALEPELLVLDEPVSALDVSVQAQMLNLLASIKAARQLTLLFISHDLDVVAWLADHVAVMYAGLLVEVGPTAAVLESPRHPYTRALLDSRPGRRAEVKATVDPPSPLRLPPGCAFHPRCPLAVDACRREVPRLEGDAHRAACPVTKGR